MLGVLFFYIGWSERASLTGDIRDLKEYGNLGENVMVRETGKYKGTEAGASSVHTNRESEQEEVDG